MERLLADANAINAEQGIMTDYTIDNFGDIVAAIDVVQGHLGLTGTAALEASETFTGSMAAAKASLQNLMADLALGNTDTLLADLQSLTTSIGAFLTNNLLPMIGNVLNGIPILVQALWTNLTTQLPTWIAGIQTALTTTLPTLLENISTTLTTAIPTLFSTLSTTIMTLLPTLFETISTTIIPTVTNLGTTLIDQLASGLAMGIPNLIAQALPMVLQLSESLRANAGQLVDSGINLVLQLAQGLMNSLPTLIAYVPQIVINIAGIINDNAPKLLTAGLQLIITLGQGLLNAIPSIVANIGSIIQAMVAVWSAFNWGQLGTNVVTFIKNGIKSLSEHVPAALKEIGNKALAGFKAIDWKGLGTNVIKFIESGVKALASIIPNALKEIGNQAVSAFKGINWMQLGKDIINGIVKGVQAMASSLINAIKGIAERAFNSVKDFFDIGSPSKLMANEIGRWIPAGIAVGIEDNLTPLTDAMTEMGNLSGLDYQSDLAKRSAYNYGANVSSGNGGMTQVIGLLERYLPNIGSDIYMDGAKVGKVVNKQLGLAL